MRRGSSSLFIIVGLFLLLAAGAAGVLFIYGSDNIMAQSGGQLPPTTEPNVPVVEAAIDIEEGTVITSTEALLKMGEIPASQFVQGVHLSSYEDARNMIATLGINAGEPLRKDALRKAGLAQKIPAPQNGEAPLKAFPVQVNSLSGVADLVQTGDFVDVLASFNMDVVTFRPGGLTSDTTENKYIITEEKSNEGSTKVLLQDVEVLDVIKPAAPAEGDANAQPTPAPEQQQAPAGEGGVAPVDKPATLGNTLNSGNWIIVIAVTNQEAETLRFALDRGIGITTMLRRAGDHTTERTVGATMRILVDSYGMPMPSYPQVSQQPLLTDVNGATKLPQVPAPAFVPEAESGNR